MSSLQQTKQIKKDYDENYSNDNHNNHNNSSIQSAFISDNVVLKPVKVPHCSGKCLGKYIGETISIVATTINLNDTFGTFLASDGFVFNIKYKKDYFDEMNNLSNKKYNQIHGSVENGSTIVYISHIPIDDHFCMWSWNKFLQLQAKYPQLFQ